MALHSGCSTASLLWDWRLEGIEVLPLTVAPAALRTLDGFPSSFAKNTHDILFSFAVHIHREHHPFCTALALTGSPNRLLHTGAALVHAADRACQCSDLRTHPGARDNAGERFREKHIGR